MTTKQRRRLDAELVRRAEEIARRVQHHRDETVDVEGDALDRAIAEINHGTEILLEQLELRQLGQLQLARQRLARGGYGRCRRCGATIDSRRLRAIPETVLCVRCAEELEHETRLHRAA